MPAEPSCTGFTASARHAEVIDPYGTGAPRTVNGCASTPDLVPPPRPGTEGGSTLLPFPAAMLIMVALAAMTLDSVIGFLAQRQLQNATAAAANDAATEAVSDRSFYEGNRVELSPSAVEEVAVARIHALIDRSRHHDLVVDAEAVAPAAAGCPWTVTVFALSRVDELFGKAMPGSTGQVAVRAQSLAAPRQSTAGC